MLDMGERSFREIFEEYLKLRGMTRAALAREVDVHQSTVARWFSQERAISAAMLGKICDILAFSEVDRRAVYELAGIEVRLLAPAAVVTKLMQAYNDDLGLRSLEPIGVSAEDAERVIWNIFENVQLRQLVLESYVNDGHRNQALFLRLLRDPSGTVRRFALTAARQVLDTDNQIPVSPEVICQIIEDENYEVALEATKQVRHLVSVGLADAQELTRANKQTYWLIKKVAIEFLAKQGGPEMLKHLYVFRTVKYHLSQAAIRNYIRREYDEGAFSDFEVSLARELLKSLLHAKERKATRQLLEYLG